METAPRYPEPGRSAPGRSLDPVELRAAIRGDVSRPTGRAALVRLVLRDLADDPDYPRAAVAAAVSAIRAAPDTVPTEAVRAVSALARCLRMAWPRTWPEACFRTHRAAIHLADRAGIEAFSKTAKITPDSRSGFNCSD